MLRDKVDCPKLLQNVGREIKMRLSPNYCWLVLSRYCVLFCHQDRTMLRYCWEQGWCSDEKACFRLLCVFSLLVLYSAPQGFSLGITKVIISFLCSKINIDLTWFCLICVVFPIISRALVLGFISSRVKVDIIIIIIIIIFVIIIVCPLTEKIILKSWYCLTENQVATRNLRHSWHTIL